MRAQTIRASLLARATITSMRGLRASIRPSQECGCTPRRTALRTTALAPSIRGRLQESAKSYAKAEAVHLWVRSRLRFGPFAEQLLQKLLGSLQTRRR